MLALLIFLFSFLVAYTGTVLLLKLRPEVRFVDVPNERSSHEAPKPRFGGIAIVSTFFLAFAFLLIKVPGTREFLPLLVGGGVVFIAGLLDDRRSIPVAWRFGAQGAAALIVVLSGHVVDHIYLPLVGTLDLGVVAIPFTVLFILTSINFYNFIDGIDGLAAGSALIGSGFLAVIAYMTGHIPLALVCLVVAGASIGFLQFNFPPSRLFMGDGGSTFLGFFFAYVAIAGNRLQPELPFFIPVLILSSLYLDAGLTLVKRAVRGEKIFRPHHTHYYQRLLSLGLNHKQVTVLEYAITILLGISAVIFVKAGGLFPFVITLSWIVVFAALILKIRGLERGDRVFWEKRSLLVIGGDLVMIAAAYFGAYFLRMGFKFTDPEGVAVLKAFPFVLIVRTACFFRYGLYRGVWKYTSTQDVLRIVKAVTTGSVIILALVVLFYRFVAFPRSLFIIEFFLLIIALAGSRFAFRLFHEFGKEAHGANVRRVAIIGAGDYGERVGREIRNASGKSASIVCYVDDDPSKVGLVLQGVPIVGPIDDLADICTRFDIDAVVLAVSDLEADRLKMIIRQARQAGVLIETREGGYVRRERMGLVELDRISRNLGRGLPVEPSAAAARFYAGKRVLITHGGEDIGPELASELARLGATVVVQVDGQRETARFAGLPPRTCRVYVGAIDRELDLGGLLDAARPQVIFHCTSLETARVVNPEDYLWKKWVRSTQSLCAILPNHPVESLVFVNLWGVAAAEETRLAALSEIMVLNAPSVLAAAPKVLRLPSLLTGEAMSDLLGRHPASADTSYALLESEAIALAIDAGAQYMGRVILAPKREAPVSAAEIPAVLKRVVRRLPIDTAPGATPMFPNETDKASILRGAREVISPIYPAADELVRIVSDVMTKSATERDDRLAGLHSALFERPRDLRSSAK